MKKLTIALILSIFASTTYAVNWVEVGNVKGSDHYIDADSIKDEWPNQKIFWGSEKFHKAQKAPNKKLYSETKFRVTIDCVKDTWFPMEEYYYTKNGNIVDQDEQWADKEVIVPGTMAQVWQEYVCE